MTISSSQALSRDQLVNEFNEAFLVRRTALVIKAASDSHWEVPMAYVLGAVKTVVDEGSPSVFDAVYADPARRGNIPWLVTFLSANSARVWKEVQPFAVRVEAGVPGQHPALAALAAGDVHLK